MVKPTTEILMMWQPAQIRAIIMEPQTIATIIMVVGIINKNFKYVFKKNMSKV